MSLLLDALSPSLSTDEPHFRLFSLEMEGGGGVWRDIEKGRGIERH